jgi:hypothetical protein
MRPLCVGLIAVMLATGCANRTAGAVEAGLGGAAAAVGGYVLFMGVLLRPPDHCNDEPAPCDDGPAVRRAGLMITIPGLVLGAIGLVTIASSEHKVASERRERDQQTAQHNRARAEKRDQAWRVTQDLAESARSNDCELVKLRAANVEELDADFYATVFLRDAAIARCMGTSGQPKPRPPSVKPPAPPDPHEAERKRERAEARQVAWKLTQDLAESARANDCARVKRRAPQIQALDPDFYATVFLRDVALARCMTPPAVLEPAP